jgi:hypothetical protein
MGWTIFTVVCLILFYFSYRGYKNVREWEEEDGKESSLFMTQCPNDILTTVPRAVTAMAICGFGALVGLLVILAKLLL